MSPDIFKKTERRKSDEAKQNLEYDFADLHAGAGRVPGHGSAGRRIVAVQRV